MNTVQVVVCVRDRAIDAFMQPFFVPALGAAIRGFQDEVNRADSPMRAHPEDYDLYVIGTFDANTGRFTNEGDSPRMVQVGKDVVKPDF